MGVGEPPYMIWVRLERSWPATPSWLAIMAIRVAGSDVMVTRSASISRSASSGRKCTQTCAPPTIGTAQNATASARWNMGAECSQVLPSRKSIVPMQSRPQQKTLALVRQTPLGSPVVPDV